MFRLIHGPDTFLSLKHAKEVARSIGAENEMEVVSMDISDIQPERIVTVLTTQGMFQENNVYLFKRIYRNKKKDEIISTILDLKDNTNIHYVVWEDQKINKTTKYFKFFGKKVETFEKGDKRTLSTWIKKELDSRGISSDTNSIRELSSRCNFDAQRVFHVIEKIELSESERLTETLVEELTADTLEVYGWDLTDALNKRDSVSALIIFEDLINQQVDPNIIIAMMSNNLKSLAQVVKLIEQNVDSSQIPKMLKLHPFVATKLIYSAKASSWREIQALFQKIYALDIASKKGEVDLQLGITLLLSRIN